MTDRPRIRRPRVLSRRELLTASALVTARLALPSLVASGCGNDDHPQSTESAALLTVDPSTPWWLQNGYEPVSDELTAFDLLHQHQPLRPLHVDRECR